MEVFFGAYTGQAAGVATSILWTATSLFFAAAGRRIGPTAVNATRLLAAIVLLGVTHRWLTGVWVPQLAAGQVVFLAISGVIGLSLGDQALIVALVDIGPRLTLLTMTTAPIFAAFFGWVFLDETIGAIGLLAIALVVGGVGWVVLERPSDESKAQSPHRTRGIILGFVGAVCQAGGLLLSKQGMGHGWLPETQHIDPQSATLVRMVFAALGMVPIVLVHSMRERARAGPPPRRIGSVRAGLLFTLGGAVVGPYLGVWMSLVASDRAPLGIAQTLCSLAPVFILPFVILIHKERVSPRAAIGAVIAVSGSALLFAPLG